MNKNNLLIIGLVVLILGGGILFFQSLNQEAVPSLEINNPIGGAPGVTIPDLNQEVKTFQVEGKPFEFSPDLIRVKKGDTVRIVFTNKEGFHDFTLDEFNIKTEQINTGQTAAPVQFVANKTGEFKFYCSVGNHRQMGMEGTLIVEE